MAPERLPRRRYRCRFCSYDFPAALPVTHEPHGVMLLHHLSAMHRDQVGQYGPRGGTLRYDLTSYTTGYTHHKYRLLCTLSAHSRKFALLHQYVLTQSPCTEGEPPMHRVLLSAVLSLSVLLSTFVAAQDALYTFDRLDVPGARRTLARGINDGSQIVGIYDDSTPGIHGFLYSPGLFTTLNAPGSIATEPYGINNRGQIVGAYQEDPSGRGHGFLYERGVFTRLDVPVPDAHSTVAFGINSRGQIVGSYIVGPIKHGFLYDAGVFTPLDVPEAYDLTAAFSINDRGEIVGIYGQSPGGGDVHGFLYRDGVFTPLDSPSGGQTHATSINNQGQIVVVDVDQPPYDSFLYVDGVYSPLDLSRYNTPTPAPNGINDRGQIVGTYSDEHGTHGFVATPQQK
jgi:uncharacterized membrane protein